MELAAELPGSTHETIVAEVRRDITVGADLTKRLSKRVKTAYVSTAERASGRAQSRDVDAALAHDGLHHRHLGPDTGDTFVGRLDDLLFVAFQEDDAYLVGVYPHGSWGRVELLERMVRNWPRADLLTEMRGVSSRTPQPSDRDRWRMMKAGVTVLVEIDSKVYVAPGQTTAGTPICVTQRVNEFAYELADLREQGLAARLKARGADPRHYWVPKVRDEFVGVESREGFVALGRLS